LRLLLDTHTLIWWLADDQTLSAEARGAIGDDRNQPFVSAVTAWEIAIKRASGKLDSPSDLEAALDASGLAQLPITVEHALATEVLPFHHRDPFDRMLIAQASVEGLTIVTRDARFAAYRVAVLPA